MADDQFPLIDESTFSPDLGQLTYDLGPMPGSTSTVGRRDSEIRLGQDETTIKHALRQMIAASGLSQKEVARRLEMKYQSLQNYLRAGKVPHRPSAEFVGKVAAVCGARVCIRFW